MRPERRKVVASIGVALSSGLAGCSGVLEDITGGTDSRRVSPEPEEAPENTPSSTPTDQSSNADAPLLAGLEFYEYSYDVEGPRASAANPSTRLYLTNPSERTYPAVFVRYGHQSRDNDQDAWVYNLGPDERELLGLWDGDHTDSYRVFWADVYPGLWPDSLPDTVPGRPFNEDADVDLLLGTETDSTIAIPTPEGVSASEVSSAVMDPMTRGGEYYEWGGNASNGMLHLPSGELSPKYIGGNPYELRLTTLSKELRRPAIIPVPEFSIDNFSAIGEAQEDSLVWQNISYELTVGPAVTDAVEVTAVFRHEGFTLAKGTARFEPDTTQQISFKKSDVENPDLPVDSREVTLQIGTPYPVAQTTTTFETP
jgi:hypothetical protein